MAYNNGFPVGYPQMYYAPQYQPMSQPVQQQAQVQQPQQQTANLIWVQGEAGAKSHLVAPNTTVALWDSEAQRIFLKSADASGMPSMKILNYSIEETPKNAIPLQSAVNAPQSDFSANKAVIAEMAQNAVQGKFEALQSELAAMRSELDSFRGDLYGIAGKKTATRKKDGEVSE